MWNLTQDRNDTSCSTPDTHWWSLAHQRNIPSVYVHGFCFSHQLGTVRYCENLCKKQLHQCFPIKDLFGFNDLPLEDIHGHLCCVVYSRSWAKNGHEKGKMPSLHAEQLDKEDSWPEEPEEAEFTLMSSVSTGTIEGEKCANINMPINHRWLGTDRRKETLPTRRWSRSNSSSPRGIKSSFHFSRGLTTPAANTGLKDTEKTIWGHEQWDQHGKHTSPPVAAIIDVWTP